MANPTVWIIRIFKTADGWRALKPLWSKRSGKPLLTQCCLFRGTEIDTPDGRWEIEWVEQGKRKRLKCSDQPSDVLRAKARQELRLQAQAAGIAVVDQKAENGKRLLATVKSEYLAECKATKAPKTHQAMKQALDTFTMVVGRKHLEDVNRADCLTKFVNHIRGRGLADRTVYHRIACLVTFLKWAKHPVIGLRDAPDEGSYPGSPHGDCPPVGNPACGYRLGQNLSTDHVRCPDFPVTVADGDVLSDRTSVLIHGVRPNHGALLRDRSIHFTDDLAIVVADQH